MNKAVKIILYLIVFITPLLFYKPFENAYFTIKVLFLKTALFAAAFYYLLSRPKITFYKSTLLLFGTIFFAALISSFFAFNFIFSAGALSFILFFIIFILLLQQNTDYRKIISAVTFSSFFVATFGILQKFIFSVRGIYGSEGSLIFKIIDFICYSQLTLFLFFLLVTATILLIIRKKRWEWLVVSAFVLGVLAFLVFYFSQLKFYHKDLFEAFSRWQRVYSTIGNPNFLSAYMIAVMPFIVFEMQQSVKGPYFVFQELNLIISILLLFITKTRGAIIAIIISPAFVIFYLYFARRISGYAAKRVRRIIITAVIIVVPLFILFGITSDMSSMLQRFGNMKNDHNIKTRLQTWMSAGRIALAHPIFGGGIDNYQSRYTFQQNKVSYVIHEFSLPTQEKRAHNEYFQFMAETGVVGASSLILLIISLIKLGLASKQSIKHYAAVTVLAIALHSLVSFPLHIISPLLIFSLAAAVILKNENDAFEFHPLPAYKNIIAAVVVLFLFALLIPQFRFSSAMQHSKYASFYRGQEDWITAAGYYKKADKSYPYLGITDHYLGTAYYMLKDYRDAAIYFRKAVQKKLWQEYLFINFGNVLANLGQNNLARDIYERAVFIAPHYAESYYNTANFYQSSGLLKKSEFYYKRALYVDPKDIDVLYNMGNMYYDRGRYDAAIAMFNKALQINPDYLKAKNNIAITLYKQGKRDAAISQLKGIIKEYPQKTKAVIDLASIYISMNQPAAARKLLLSAAKRKQDPEIYFALGNIEYNAHNYKKAKEYFLLNSRLAPTDARAFNNLALTEYSLGNTDEALALYKKAMDLNPNYAEAKNNYRKLKLFLARKTGGAESIEQKAYNEMAAGKYKAAAELYEKLLLKDPANFIYKINAGFSFYKLGNTDKAEKYLYSGLTNKKNIYFEKFNTLGNIYYNSKRYDSAVWAYNMLLKKKPDDYLTIYNLGAVYLAKGNVKKCLELWESVKGHFTKDSDFMKNYNIVKQYVK